jgi:glycosyltransferase involved in cell wall biosynthesis
MRRIQHKCNVIIAISSYLEKYYRNSSSIPVVRIPPLLDLLDNELPKRLNTLSTGRLSFVFAGNAGKKDLIINAIRGLALLGEQAKLCEIAIIGPSSGELRKSLGANADLLIKLSGSLLFTGRLPHPEALNNVALADFSILPRPDARFAHAGFPTKLVESLGMGTPLICNLTSDIGVYVHDGQEGIVVKDSSPEAFAEGVRRALALTADERMVMRHRARKCAEDNFDYRNWVKPIGEFMDIVLGHNKQLKD